LHYFALSLGLLASVLPAITLDDSQHTTLTLLDLASTAQLLYVLPLINLTMVFQTYLIQNSPQQRNTKLETYRSLLAAMVLGATLPIASLAALFDAISRVPSSGAVAVPLKIGIGFWLIMLSSLTTVVLPFTKGANR
jgi:hypothetical protein